MLDIRATELCERRPASGTVVVIPTVAPAGIGLEPQADALERRSIVDPPLLKRSSQHLDGSCDEHSKTALGSFWAGGLVPKRRSSGGRARLFGISERGDRYLRTLLIHGARAALGRLRDKQDPRSLWLGRMRQELCGKLGDGVRKAA